MEENNNENNESKTVDYKPGKYKHIEILSWDQFYLFIYSLFNYAVISAKLHSIVRESCCW
jgi:hypothetical protein